MAQNPSAMRETCVRSLGLEDPLEEGMATHSSILAWRIPCTEEPSLAGSSPWGFKSHKDTTKRPSMAQHGFRYKDSFKVILFSYKNFKMEFQKLSRVNIFLISDINQNFQKLNYDFSETEFWNLKHRISHSKYSWKRTKVWCSLFFFFLNKYFWYHCQTIIRVLSDFSV